MNVDDFSELWSDPKGRYVLIRVREAEGVDGLAIIDQRNGMMELIDDDELNAAVIQRMIDAGVPVVEEPAR